MSHELFIKNMVCNRCVMAVDDLLRRNGLHPVSVELGHALWRKISATICVMTCAGSCVG